MDVGASFVTNGQAAEADEPSMGAASRLTGDDGFLRCYRWRGARHDPQRLTLVPTALGIINSVIMQFVGAASRLPAQTSP